jgi:hypothetical protein
LRFVIGDLRLPICDCSSAIAKRRCSIARFRLSICDLRLPVFDWRLPIEGRASSQAAFPIGIQPSRIDDGKWAADYRQLAIANHKSPITNRQWTTGNRQSFQSEVRRAYGACLTRRI